MGVEIDGRGRRAGPVYVMPREGHGSRNLVLIRLPRQQRVMPREGHGSRNEETGKAFTLGTVMPREGHGSRNLTVIGKLLDAISHAPRGAWE